MDEREIGKVLKKIRTVVYHVGTFEGSYPRILKDAPIYTRSHLIVLYEVLPYLKHLLKFSSETIPVITKILGLATEGKSDLEKASEYLRTINQSSETAVTEIFAALDQVGGLLQQAQKAETVDDDLKKTLGEANMQLMSIMNALQFQDITAQKIEATNALLAKLGDGLIELIRELGLGIDAHSIQVREGTYDPNAAFDRDTAGSKQDEIDDLISSAPPPKAEPVQPKTPEETPEEKDIQTDDIDDLVTSMNGNGSVRPEEASVDQDDIDDLVSSAGDADTSGPVDQDSIDDLISSAGKEEPSEPVEQGDIDDLVSSEIAEEPPEPVAQNDIDDLIASAQEDETDVGQDDIDNLVASAADKVDEDVNQDDIDSLVTSAQDKKAVEEVEEDASSEFSQDDIDALLGDS